jgi:hypothetical protein
MQRRALVAILLGACGGAAAPALPGPAAMKPVVPPKAAVGPACISPPEDAATITRARTYGSGVEFCIGERDDQCFGVEVATSTFIRLDRPPSPTKPDGARVETTKPEVKVCTGDACVPLTQNVYAATSSLRGATNADGSLAVFLLGDAPAGKGYAEIWDVPKTKRLAKFRYARGDFKCGDVQLLGNTIYVAAATCNEPAARAGLYNTFGRRLAHVGGRDFGTFGNKHVQIDASTWAFLEENGGVIAIQDVVTGRILKVIDLKVLWKDRGAAMGNPGESALLRLDDGKLVVIAGAPATGSLAAIDTANGEIEIIPAPACN